MTDHDREPGAADSPVTVSGVTSDSAEAAAGATGVLPDSTLVSAQLRVYREAECAGDRASARAAGATGVLRDSNLVSAQLSAYLGFEPAGHRAFADRDSGVPGVSRSSSDTATHMGVQASADSRLALTQTSEECRGV